MMDKKILIKKGNTMAAIVAYSLSFPDRKERGPMADNASNTMDGIKAATYVAYALSYPKRQEK